MTFSPASCFCLALFAVSSANSIRVTCDTDGTMKMCQVTGVTEDMELTGYTQRNPGTLCDQGQDYDFLYTDNRSHIGMVWVMPGCGGTFELTSNTNTAAAVDPTNSGKTGGAVKSTGGKKSSTGSLSSTCGQYLSRSYRVLGGEDATRCQYPWMVTIMDRVTYNFCGGSIIDNKHILTAGHCFYDRHLCGDISKDLVVMSGSILMPFGPIGSHINPDNVEGLKMRNVSMYKRHEKYNHKDLTNDVSIVTLAEPIQFDDCHVPLCLSNDQHDPKLTDCQIMGWGSTRNSDHTPASILKHTYVSILGHKACEDTFRPGVFNGTRQICGDGDGHGQCKGDSGGPLLCLNTDGRYYQYGIVSGGRPGFCAVVPGFYSKVSYFLPWIKANSDVDY